MSVCSFCRILSGHSSSHRVFEDAASLAFLDWRPLFYGHVLVVPKTHYGTLADLPPAVTGRLFRNVQRLSLAVERAMGADGTFVAMNNRVSQSVPHLHVHVVPRRKGDGLRGFFWPRHAYEDDSHMASVAASIVEALRNVPGGEAHVDL